MITTSKKCNVAKKLDEYAYRKSKTRTIQQARCKICLKEDSKKYQDDITADPIRHNRRRLVNKKSAQLNYKTHYLRKKEKLKNDPVAREKDRARKRRHKAKMRSDPNYCINVKLCSRLRATVKSGKNWEEYLGCSMEFLRTWFEY
jgi:hypothetical protein